MRVPETIGRRQLDLFSGLMSDRTTLEWGGPGPGPTATPTYAHFWRQEAAGCGRSRLCECLHFRLCATISAVLLACCRLSSGF